MSASEAVAKTKVSATRKGKPKGAGALELRVVEGFKVEVDESRDALLTDFGKTTLIDRYLLPGESFQDMFARVSVAYADDPEHAQRLY
ncbi:MAG: ribonucleotide reductase N-terminal alpha domain-containing protein, partial [Pseudomonadota bacterium]